MGVAVNQRSAKIRKSRARRPYSWLGAGAVTLGMGAALASGSAVAHADTGQSGTASDSGSTSASATKPRAGIAHTRPHAASVSSGSSSGSVRASSTPSPAASRTRNRGVAAAQPRAATSATDVAESPTAEPTDDWGQKSYLPDNEVVVPGSAVRLALQEITQTQQLLHAQTWGTGNIVAGVASIVPQVFLAQAAWSLTTWQNTIEGAKAAVATTAGVPVAHQLAQLSLLATLMLPTAAGLALDAAALSAPLVGVLGAPAAASQAAGLIRDAKSNAQVYAVRLLRTVNTTQQIVYISVNGGPVVPVLLDTGSSGLSILSRYVGQENLGPATGTGSSAYGDDSTSVSYTYTKYRTTVDFGNGVVTSPFDIMVVDPGSEAVYDNYGTAGTGVVGTLGIGVNAGSGPTLNALLPGELKDGILMYQNIIGPWGLVVMGPNPLPVKGSVAGAPVGDVQVQIDDGPLQPLKTSIDSGGVTGGLPTSVAGSAAEGTSLKPGTRVSVYTADGQTLLYSYTITDSNSPVLYDDSTASTSRPNTGNIPFQLSPIYLDYGAPDRLGSTNFVFF